MGHGEFLTEKEYSQFTLNKEIYRYLEACRQSLELEKSEMNILDWGCGRGLSVAWLRERGYNAFGVDIDLVAIHHGTAMLESHGHEVSRILSPIKDDCIVNYPDNFFHFVFSTQVLEHVENMDRVAAEICRITKPGGHGLHVYPSHLHIIEAHLFMPFVHWLPKNIVRKSAIFFFTFCGIRPDWGEDLKDKGPIDRANTYYDYSINYTHYRDLSTISNIFQKMGLPAKSVSINHPIFSHNKFIYRLLRISFLRSIIDWTVNNFKTVELFTIKPYDQ
jgi:SAM-dependent methyltransferase